MNRQAFVKVGLIAIKYRAPKYLIRPLRPFIPLVRAFIRALMRLFTNAQILR